MKEFLQILCLSVAALFPAACSDDDAPALRPVLPAEGGDNVVRIEHLGSVATCYDWQFAYSDSRLTRAAGTLRDASDEVDASYRYTTDIAYGSNSVTVSSSGGEEIALTLNAQGYIGRMQVDRNTYNFSYGTDGRLAAWDKTVFEQTLGQARQYRSSAVLSYSVGGALARIVFTDTDGSVRTLTLTTSSVANTNGLLPVGVSEEMGCLGFEQLYYAGLLGRPAARLTASVSYAFEDATKDYTVSYSYYSEGGNTTLCNYTRPDGSIASVRYSY